MVNYKIALGATAILAAGVVAVGVLANASRGESSIPVAALSEQCGTSSTLEWNDDPGAETPRAAIEQVLSWHRADLESLPNGSGGADPKLPLELDPVRLSIVVRGLEAALENIEDAQRAAAQGDGFTVTGYLGNVPISEVRIEPQRQSSGYRVSQYATFGLTTDDPGCAVQRILPGE